MKSLNLTNSPSNKPIRQKYDSLDKSYWNKIDAITEKYGLTNEFLMKNYLSFIRRRDMPRLLAHYEIFKQIIELPGSIVEVGVYTGNGLFTFANLLETFAPGDRIRKVIGFDNFDGYNDFHKLDYEAENFIRQNKHHLKIEKELIEELLELHTDDNLLRGVERAIIINGNIKKTVPEFAVKSKGLKLSLLYLDANLYEPTQLAIKYFYPMLVPGGIVAFNGYGQFPWHGETKAIDGLFAKLKQKPVIKRFPFSTIPSGYFQKEY